MNALGMVEVCGFTTAICCADIAAKAADVKIIALDKNKPAAGDSAAVPLIMNVKMEGSVAAVEAAVEAAKKHAVEKDLYVTSHIIPRPGIGTEKMAYISEVGKDRWIDNDKAKQQEVKPEITKTVTKPAVEAEKPALKDEKVSENKAVSEQLTIAPEKKPRGRKPKNSK